MTDELDIVQALIDGGADVNAMDDNGNRPIQYFISGRGSYERYYPVIRALIEAGSDVNLQNEVGENLLFNAQGEAWATYLIRAGVDPCHRTSVGETPLHSDVDAGAIRALLAAGADPNALDELNETPLFNKDVEGCRLLLAAGVDPSVVSRSGATAAEWLAEEYGDDDAAELVAQALLAKQQKAFLDANLPASQASNVGAQGKGRL